MVFDDWDKEVMELFTTALNYSISEILPNDVNFLSLTSFALVYKKEEKISLKNILEKSQVLLLSIN